MKIKIVKVMQMIALLFSVHLFATEQTEIKISPIRPSPPCNVDTAQKHKVKRLMNLSALRMGESKEKNRNYG